MALDSVAPYAFNPNELLTLGIAAYAAVVSTFVLGWDAYKWLASGAKIDLSASTGMRIVGGSVEDPNTYVSITAWNVGDQPTPSQTWGVCILILGGGHTSPGGGLPRLSSSLNRRKLNVSHIALKSEINGSA